MVHRWLAVVGLVGGVGLLAENASAQNQDRSQIMRKHAAAVAAHIDRIPARHRDRLSSGAMLLHQLNDTWSRLEAMASLVPGGPKGPAVQLPTPQIPVSPALTGGRVSNPKADITFSSMLGFTQSESSTAWCGSNVVIAYNDSGSFPESFFLGPGGLSFNGYSTSNTVGVKYTDQGFLNPSSDPGFFLSGDPVVGCTNATTFYQASLLEDYTLGNSAISLSKSTDGGVTWGDPVKAVEKSFSGHFLDKDWMTVDPANPNNVFVTYTDFDSSFPNACSSTTSIFRTAIELVRSTDAGVTWSAPVVIDLACNPDGNQGSQVAVDNTGAVFVSYEHFPSATPTNTLRIAKSTDSGATFGAPVDAATVTPTGGISAALSGRQTLQGGIRTNDFPQMAIDRTTGTRANNIYLVWQDGARNPVADPLSGSPPFPTVGGTYNYADIRFTRSSDGGATFSAPLIVNNTVEPIATGPTAGLGSDQFMPGIAVDKTGAIQVCFYDRRKDPSNFLIERYCAKSTTATSFSPSVKKSTAQYMSNAGQDFVIAAGYQGDYDSLASDATKTLTGFIGGYFDNSLGNQDMKATKN
jgi:hypothetical protein